MMTPSQSVAIREIEAPALTRDLIETGMRDIENLMHTIVDSDVHVLRDASRHILDAGGKRVRPRLALLAFGALGGKPGSPAYHDLVRAAAALELVHTASVVHDDINDHGVMRRGRPSVNQIWGRTFALLTGDFLFTKVYQLMAPLNELNTVLAEATLALVEGETLQAAAVKENRLNREVYYDIIARKTAALFRAGAAIGARVAGADADQERALAQFGFNVGLAFQIVDDILDITATPEQLGKTAGIDVEQGRGIGVALASESAAQSPDPMVTIRNKIMQGDTIKQGYDHAALLITDALNQLEFLAESPFRDELVAYAHAMVNRKS
ncbi:MAG: polyprenyl synthetase family protein [Candidatus Flexifilum sp.]